MPRTPLAKLRFDDGTEDRHSTVLAVENKPTPKPKMINEAIRYSIDEPAVIRLKRNNAKVTIPADRILTSRRSYLSENQPLTGEAIAATSGKTASIIPVCIGSISFTNSK